MYARRKLSVTVAALIVSTQLGSPLGAAAPTSGHIGYLQDHLAAGDLDALAGFLSASPDLLVDGSPLSQALGNFMAAYQSGAFTSFSSEELSMLESSLASACRASGDSSGARDCSIY